MITNKLKLEDSLPLTCSRAGTCCHGNIVTLNPWELHSLAKVKKISAEAFRDMYCEAGGSQLKFNGKVGWRNKKACSQYVENFGCSVHEGRPLACRLFPLGRQIQNNQALYMHEGSKFPCLDGCPEVVELPSLTVREYLSEQKAESFETAQDLYLDMMQNIADMAFELLLDSGLAESGDKKTLPMWRKLGSANGLDKLETEWLNMLVVPKTLEFSGSATKFVQNHFKLIQKKIQDKINTISTNKEFHETSILVMGLALHLARSIGADPKSLANHWADTAKGFGAKE